MIDIIFYEINRQTKKKIASKFNVFQDGIMPEVETVIDKYKEIGYKVDPEVEEYLIKRWKEEARR